MAYARYRGKSLPTVYQWARASLPDTEIPSSLAASIVPLSRFVAKGPRGVSSSQSRGPYGTYDMQGNAREWCLNTGPNGGRALGGAWEEPDYYYDMLFRSRFSNVRELWGFVS